MKTAVKLMDEIRREEGGGGLKCYSWQRPLCFTGNSTGHPPSAINGTGPFVGPPEANRLWVFCGLGGALLDALPLEGLTGDALLGAAVLDATLAAATLPPVP